MRKTKPFRKLKRVELVELIYELRKDNVALEKRCQGLEARLAESENQLEVSLRQPEESVLARIESMMDDIRGVYEARTKELEAECGKLRQQINALAARK